MYLLNQVPERVIYNGDVKIPVTWGWEKRYVFIFISNLTYFSRSGNFTAASAAAKMVLFGLTPGSWWQSVVQFPGLSIEADFQVPTRTIRDDEAL